MQYAASGTRSLRRTSHADLGANSHRLKRIALETEFSFDRASMPRRTRAFDRTASYFVRIKCLGRLRMLLIAKDISIAEWDSHAS
jgi:hypothetical protein